MKYQLTKEQAKFIRDLRCVKDYTWRTVARDFTNRWPEVESPTENQYVGMTLCNDAMDLLGETIDNGWN